MNRTQLKYPEKDLPHNNQYIYIHLGSKKVFFMLVPHNLIEKYGQGHENVEIYLHIGRPQHFVSVCV